MPVHYCCAGLCCVLATAGASTEGCETLFPNASSMRTGSATSRLIELINLYLSGGRLAMTLGTEMNAGQSEYDRLYVDE